MTPVNFKKEVLGTLDSTLQKVTVALQAGGFGILTRIDFHDKIKEKLNKEVEPTIFLGACNPQIAYDIFQIDKNITSLMPCNVVLRQVTPNRISVEVASPIAMVKMLGDSSLEKIGANAETKLRAILENIN